MMDEPRFTSYFAAFSGQEALPPNKFLELVLTQLGLIFLLSPSRSDPYIVAPVVALYAVRQADRRAMWLYVVLGAVSCPLDLLFLFSADAGGLVKLLALASLALKVALFYPAVKLHDALPASPPERVDAAQLQLTIKSTIEDALDLPRSSSSAATPASSTAGTAAPATAPPPQQQSSQAQAQQSGRRAVLPTAASKPPPGGSSSWEEV